MAQTFDPASDRIVLTYVGDGRPVSGVPARDLTEHDLCRIQYRRELTATAGEETRPDPRKPNQEGFAALVEELLSRGHWTAAEAPKKPTKPTKPAAPAIAE